jgi:hypothetical protein
VRQARLMGRQLRGYAAGAIGWLNQRFNVDRLIAVTGLASTVGLGLVSIAIVSPSAVGPLVAVTGIGAACCAALVWRLGRTQVRQALLSVHELPYRIAESRITADIVGDHGELAFIRNEEVIVPQQDHMVALRRAYSGAWAPLSIADLACDAPPGSVVADCFNDGSWSYYLLSLRRVYNVGDRFSHRAALRVQDGFTNPHEEYFEWTVLTRIDRLSIVVVLPKGRSLIRTSAKLRVGDAGAYDTYELPSSSVTRSHGRDVISWSREAPDRGHFYRLVWQWEAVDSDPGHPVPSLRRRRARQEGLRDPAHERE